MRFRAHDIAQLLEAWKALETFPLSYAEKTDYTELGERIQQEVDAYRAAGDTE